MGFSDRRKGVLACVMIRWRASSSWGSGSERQAGLCQPHSTCDNCLLLMFRLEDVG